MDLSIHSLQRKKHQGIYSRSPRLSGNRSFKSANTPLATAAHEAQGAKVTSKRIHIT